MSKIADILIERQETRAQKVFELIESFYTIATPYDTTLELYDAIENDSEISIIMNDQTINVNGIEIAEIFINDDHESIAATPENGF